MNYLDEHKKRLREIREKHGNGFALGVSVVVWTVMTLLVAGALGLIAYGASFFWNVGVASLGLPYVSIWNVLSVMALYYLLVTFKKMIR
jgi:hypothetical protein